MARVEIEGEIINANGEGLALYGDALAGTRGAGAYREFIEWYTTLSPKERKDFNRVVAPDDPVGGVMQNEARRRNEHPLKDALLNAGLEW